MRADSKHGRAARKPQIDLFFEDLGAPCDIVPPRRCRIASSALGSAFNELETKQNLYSASTPIKIETMEICSSAAEFFHGEVRAALEARHLEANESTEFYLVNLLCEYTTTAVDDDPLSLKLAAAQQQSPDERFRLLKEVGDTSLYMSGFFAEALARRLVDVDYYMTMGGSAYGQLAGMVGGVTRGATRFRDVYEELAAKFPAFVDVLGEIRSRSAFAPGGNVIRLYEEWVRTRSEWLEKRLRAAGLIMDGGREQH
jgi:methylphosphotriester-DNA--protein-cysteine methyltransferase